MARSPSAVGLTQSRARVPDGRGASLRDRLIAYHRDEAKRGSGMMRMADELRNYLADLSRRVDCVFVDLDGGRWVVSELDFFNDQIWIRARPESARRLDASSVPARVFHSDVHPGTRLEFVLDDGAVVQLTRSRRDGELRLKLRNQNGGDAAVGDPAEVFGHNKNKMEA